MATPFRLEVLPQEACDGPKEQHILVSLKSEEGGTRGPSDFCCVLDISGSMGAEAYITGAGGRAESHGLSLLDIAKHGVRTVIQTMGDNDRLSIIAFNHMAVQILELTKMDEAGKRLAEEKLDSVSAGGGTDIWLGLEGGLESLRTGDGGLGSGRFGHIMLLTDGESSDRHLILPNLKTYREKYERLPGTVNTFGFGYNIDSKLLVELADAGDGSYSFIPDAGFVGTCFVNTMSNLLVTAAREAFVSVSAEEGAEILEVCGDLEFQKHDWGVRVRLGCLQFGQSRDILVFAKTVAGDCVLANLEYIGPNDPAPKTLEEHVGNKTEASKVQVETQLCRAKAVDALKISVKAAAGEEVTLRPSLTSSVPFASAGAGSPGGTVSRTFVSLQAQIRRTFTGSTSIDESAKGGTLANAQEALSELTKEIKATSAAATADVKALLQDLEGQACEAVSKPEFFAKWGKHYLPSLTFAHKLQQCNNFKDPGVQHYGGRMFNSIRDEADKIFNDLPAPKPSAGGRGRGGYGGGAMAAPVNMAAYNDPNAGCIDGSSLVRLVSGEETTVAELRKGDKVLGVGEEVAEILCLVRIPCVGGSAKLVELSAGLRLTPYHPVHVQGSWQFPADLADVRERPCDAVYSFVVAGSAGLAVGGVPCIALGHGIQEGAAAHPFFAGKKIIEQLSLLKGFEDGYVEISGGAFQRDPLTGLVCGLGPVA